MARKLAILTAAAGLAGCAAYPDPPALPDYGRPPGHQAATDAIHQHLQQRLRDYESMRDLVMLRPVPDCYRTGQGGGWFCGQKVCFQYNAKNAYGAYVGLRPYVAWFRGDVVAGGIWEAGNCPPFTSPASFWRE